nr:MAG TPA: hypothetical protein [Caudoviricetes sp.]
MLSVVIARRSLRGCAPTHLTLITKRRERQMLMLPRDPDFYFISFLYLGIAVLLCG